MYNIVDFFKCQHLFLRVYVDRSNYVYEEIRYLFTFLSKLSFYDLFMNKLPEITDLAHLRIGQDSEFAKF
jgi:hypothetical protein